MNDRKYRILWCQEHKVQHREGLAGRKMDRRFISCKKLICVLMAVLCMNHLSACTSLSEEDSDVDNHIENMEENSTVEKINHSGDEKEKEYEVKTTGSIDPKEDGGDDLKKENVRDSMDDSAKTEEKISLEDRGLELLRLLDEMVHRESYFRSYLESYSSSAAEAMNMRNIYEKLSKVSYDRPERIFRITYSEEAMKEVIEFCFSNGDYFEGMSEELKKWLLDQWFLGWNYGQESRVGVYEYGSNDYFERMHMTSLYQISTSFLGDKRNMRCLYLYTFSEQYPVLIGFAGSEDGIVNACVRFIIDDNLKTDSIEDVKDFFKFDLGDTSMENYGIKEFIGDSKDVFDAQVEQVR